MMSYTKEQKKEYNRRYRIENRDKILERTREYRQQNKDRIKEYSRRYNEKYGDIIRKKQLEKVRCYCGCMITRTNLSRHQKSPKHSKIMDGYTSIGIDT